MSPLSQIKTIFGSRQKCTYSDSQLISTVHVTVQVKTVSITYEMFLLVNPLLLMQQTAAKTVIFHSIYEKWFMELELRADVSSPSNERKFSASNCLNADCVRFAIVFVSPKLTTAVAEKIKFPFHFQSKGSRSTIFYYIINDVSMQMSFYHCTHRDGVPQPTISSQNVKIHERCDGVQLTTEIRSIYSAGEIYLFECESETVNVL